MKNTLIVQLGVCALVAALWSCSGGNNGVTNSGGGPPLTVVSINPATLARGAQGAPLTVTGSGFTANTLIDCGSGITVLSKEVPNAQTIDITVDVLPSAAAGPRTVVLTSGANSAQLQSGLTISDNKAPIASFIASPSQGTLQTLFELDASASTDDGRIATYRWQISDGSNPSGMKLKKQFSKKGKYTILLTVTDDKGGVSTAERTVEVADNKPPQAVFTMTPSSGSQLTNFEFDASESLDPDGEISSYQWDLGGFSINGKKVTHKFAKAGDYNIVLKVRDSSGSFAYEEKKLSVIFFDREQAKKEISDVVVDFLKLFDNFENLSAEEIVRGFSKSPDCPGRAHELFIIDNEKATVAYGVVEFLAPVDVPYVDDQRGLANITNRFYGEFKDGTSFNGKATHHLSMTNESDGWKICNFYVTKE